VFGFALVKNAAAAFSDGPNGYGVVRARILDYPLNASNPPHAAV
jgi:hypothetical protein